MEVSGIQTAISWLVIKHADHSASEAVYFTYSKTNISNSQYDGTFFREYQSQDAIQGIEPATPCLVVRYTDHLKKEAEKY